MVPAAPDACLLSAFGAMLLTPRESDPIESGRVDSELGGDGVKTPEAAILLGSEVGLGVANACIKEPHLEPRVWVPESRQV